MHQESGNPSLSLSPIPLPEESFDRFTIRAHRELLNVVTDPAERNAVVKNSWRTHRGPTPEEQVAEKSFPGERYELSEDHCVFAEHETVKSDGKGGLIPVKYALPDLVKIVRQHNREIRDVGAFPSITSHHTPDPTDPNGKAPDVLGHAGPYRLGMIGNEQPRWAIFCDEHRRKDAIPVFDANPFRSPEVWTFKDGRRRFHPIAVVGAEAPRLQMPAKYTEPANIQEMIVGGATVEKYTVAAIATPAKYNAAGAPAMAGGSNTFVQSPVAHQPSTYTSDPTQGEPMAADPQIVAQIMAALQETPEFQYLRKCMEADMAQAQQPAQQPEAPVDPAAAPAGATPDPAPEPVAPESPADPPVPKEEPDAYAEDDELSDLSDLLQPEEEAEKFSLNSRMKTATQPNPASNGDVVTVEKYTALQQSHNKAIKHIEGLHNRLQSQERRASDADRRQRLAALAEKHPYAVVLEEEQKACLYSLGSKMTDAEFESHVGTIEKYAARFEASPMIPRGELPEKYTRRGADVEKYEQRLSEEATKIHAEGLKAGKSMTFDECWEAAKKRVPAS